jgi:hypothetical protein
VLVGLAPFTGLKFSDEIQLPYAFGTGPVDWWIADHDRSLRSATVYSGVGCDDPISEDNGTALRRIFDIEGAYVARLRSFEIRSEQLTL